MSTTPEDQDHQAMWPKIIAALAEIDAALGIPDDGCNSTARTLSEIARLRAALGLCEKDAGRYRWLRKDFTRLVVSTVRDQAADDDRLFVVDIQVSKHLLPTDAISVDAAVDAAMPAARTVEHLSIGQTTADSDAIRAAAELACGLLWMSGWRRDKAHFAFVALRDALGGPGSKGLGAAIQRAIDSGYEADHPPECDGWAGMKEFPA